MVALEPSSKKTLFITYSLRPTSILKFEACGTLGEYLCSNGKYFRVCRWYCMIVKTINTYPKNEITSFNQRSRNIPHCDLTDIKTMQDIIYYGASESLHYPAGDRPVIPLSLQRQIVEASSGDIWRSSDVLQHVGNFYTYL